MVFRFVLKPPNKVYQVPKRTPIFKLPWQVFPGCFCQGVCVSPKERKTQAFGFLHPLPDLWFLVTLKSPYPSLWFGCGGAFLSPRLQGKNWGANGCTFFVSSSPNKSCGFPNVFFVRWGFTVPLKGRHAPRLGCFRGRTWAGTPNV